MRRVLKIPHNLAYQIRLALLHEMQKKLAERSEVMVSNS